MKSNLNSHIFIKSNKRYLILGFIFVIISYLIIMSYEAGSKECRNLIDAKESLLSAMESLSGIVNTEHLQLQIKDIYNTLENMHEKRRNIESTAKN